MARVPRILFIDDDSGKVRPIATELATAGIARARVLVPGEITERDLDWADLLLVDFELADWPGRDNAPELALKPRDGLALAAVLRRHTDAKDRRPPTAIAIFTGEYSRLLEPLGGAVGHHVAARLSGLEWAFEKSEPDFRRRVISLASAVQALPNEWGKAEGGAWKQIYKLLGWRSNTISRAVLDDIRECRPPVSVLSNWNHGLILLRWLLHRVLPYPTCVYSNAYLAARLGLDAESLENIVSDPRARLGRWLRTARYRGVLSDFCGPRWWRAEVERIIWKATQGSVSDPMALQKVLRREGGTRIQFLPNPRQHVVCVDQLLQPVSGSRPLDECVRIQPDDWPPFAAAAWVGREAVSADAALGALVLAQDRSLGGGVP